ncbi:hypothetical protein BV25DRAFT_1839804 [Artomyces pyxidatus]|uniref:Uncharacterized protein n=1 Tax=Artomyces pyxidatus TaxID=48021 RepID=A0ACB8SUU4_9AGAM|nr:hypothetical protein BV25DRAFT_1839804 [Artomyces pyxidatus]
MYYLSAGRDAWPSSTSATYPPLATFTTHPNHLAHSIRRRSGRLRAEQLPQCHSPRPHLHHWDEDVTRTSAVDVDASAITARGQSYAPAVDWNLYGGTVVCEGPIYHIHSVFF